VPTEAARRHITANYQLSLDRALAAVGRADTRIRLVVTGDDYEDDET
jgi:hypothetical protein